MGFSRAFCLAPQAPRKGPKSVALKWRGVHRCIKQFALVQDSAQQWDHFGNSSAPAKDLCHHRSRCRRGSNLSSRPLRLVSPPAVGYGKRHIPRRCLVQGKYVSRKMRPIPRWNIATVFRPSKFQVRDVIHACLDSSEPSSLDGGARPLASRNDVRWRRTVSLQSTHCHSQ